METTVQLEAFGGSALPRVSKFPSQSLNILGLSLKAQDLTRLNPDIIGEIREMHPLLILYVYGRKVFQPAASRSLVRGLAVRIGMTFFGLVIWRFGDLFY